METPEQRVERIFKEDDEKKERDKQQYLHERKQKRVMVFLKHKDALDAMLVGKQKNIRFRRFFYTFITMTSGMSFATEVEEYAHIGKAGREKWSDYDAYIKTFTKDELKVADEIVHEFGAYDY